MMLWALRLHCRAADLVTRQNKFNAAGETPHAGADRIIAEIAARGRVVLR
jgi:hypothetical protein